MRHLKKYMSLNQRLNTLKTKTVSRLALFLAMAFLIGTWGIVYAIQKPTNAGFQIDKVMAQSLIDLTNSERSQHELASLKENMTLDDAALAKAQDMFTNQYFAHTSPKGIEPWYWIDQSGYAYVYAGENLAIDFQSSGKLFEAWMDSPAHAENILQQQYRDIGIAALSGVMHGQKTTVVVQVFGTPEN